MRMKTTRAFRTISEAGEELGLQPHVLRFWESKFSDITPIKRSGGRRFYRPEDIEFLRGIKTLLHDEKHPIKDVQKLIAKSGAARIVELGRSVEEASRERDLSDTTLVPKRIEKPSKPAPTPIQTNTSPQIPEPVAELAPAPSLEPEPIPAPTPEPQDLSGLQDALGRLHALKGQWDKFDASK
jgi:DNA-binding transcriptional MerR regulator